MTIRVKRPDGDWDEVVDGRVAFHERGGVLHVQTPDEPVFYEATEWEAFETVLDPILVNPENPDEVVIPEGFV